MKKRSNPNRKLVAEKRRRDLRARAVAYKGGKCTICKYDGCAAAFDFHHTDPQGKDFAISERMTSWERIVPELDKCVLVCCRCHREIHDGLHTGFLELDGAGRGQLDVEFFEEETEHVL